MLSITVAGSTFGLAYSFEARDLLFSPEIVRVNLNLRFSNNTHPFLGAKIHSLQATITYSALNVL